MRQFGWIFATVFTILSLSACSKEDPQPEIRDPIYNELAAKSKALDEEVKSLKEKLANLEIDLEKAEPNSISKKDVEKDLRKHKKMLQAAQQSLTYYKIRAERRKLVDKLTYKEAYAAGKEWPDPKEFEQYQTSLRLREANRNWSARVPRLADRMSASLERVEKKPEASKSDGEE